MKLYSYFRSSASYRVRIALNLKGLEYEVLPVHLVKNGGEQLSDTFKQINPDALVPALVDQYQGQEFSVNQSLAMMEYLEEVYPEIPLLPKDPVVRAKIRAFALGIACEIHPVNNLRVLKYLSKDLGLSDEQKNIWYQHWCMSGLRILEQRLVEDQCAGRFCFGDTPSLADCCLIPQIFNAQRFNCDLSQVPTLMSINQHCMQLPAFMEASPARQIDAE
ncbi:maleylacetoacetate isomerase [Undibacterium sp. RuTC16W]|uniref:maleylacetoacetate isomerase n=1 Tax=Undibacterium sp. RuTC16W TaxID=3413048 RepID=UPI003BF2FEED